MDRLKCIGGYKLKNEKRGGNMSSECDIENCLINLMDVYWAY